MNEAELLFSELLGLNRMRLYERRSLQLGRKKGEAASSVLKRRIAGEPLQYILGKSEFMGLEFKITPDVLIPRPETEILVEAALRVIGQCCRKKIRVLDIGTGSGCIAVSLVKFLPSITVDAVDISAQALSVARENAFLNKTKVNFIKSDLFSCAALKNAKYDAIITNPPYIASPEIRNLQIEVQYEPLIALNGAEDGLDFYRRISRDAAAHLLEDGMLVMEMGFGQKEAIKNILHKAGCFEIIEVIKDYNNIDRVLIARKVEKWINYQ